MSQILEAHACADGLETSSAGQSQRLDPLQETMLLWERVHPYTSAHAAFLAGQVDAVRLREAVNAGCRLAGVGELELDPARRRLRHRPAASIELEVLEIDDDAESTLCGAVDELLNRPFPTGPHVPLRWAVFDDVRAGQHVVVLAYHHVIADAHAIMRLLLQVIGTYRGGVPPERSVTHPAAFPHGRQRPRRVGLVRCAGAMVRTARQYFILRSAHRPREDRGASNRTQIKLNRITGDDVERLRAACRHRGCGLNDAVVASVACALATRSRARRKPGRRAIAIGMSVDCRRRGDAESSEYFGVCLTTGVVVVDRPDAPFDEVLESVTAQSRRLKQWRDRSDPAAKLVMLKYGWPLMRIPQRKSSYRKLFPICAGVSTVAVDPGLARSLGADVVRYIRAAPPGPSMPMVISPTLFDSNLELTLVYRPTHISPAEAADLLADVRQRLQAFAESRR